MNNFNHSREPQKQRGRFKLPRFKTLLMIALACGAILFVGMTTLFIVASRDVQKNFDPSKQQEFTAQSTRFYDRTEKHLLYETYEDQKRTVITLDQMSEYLPKAVVAIEDKHFYEHHGIRIPSIIRAGFSNLFHLDTGRGGASTITQQFLKNRVFGQQTNIFAKIMRKIKEVIMAVEVEKMSSKDVILTAYLNEIWFGSTNYGVESAAQTYFGKKSKDLDLAESATIAALIQNPGRYLKDPEALDGRRDTVLENMYEQGYVSKEQKERAQNENPEINLAGGVFEAPHFVMYVRDWVDEKFGKAAVRTGGYKVITTLDYDKQKIAEPIVKELGEKFVKENNAKQAAFVALDPKTGQILALVGSYDFNCKDCKGAKYDHVTQGDLQPGSSFKPFVYLNAFEKGYTPETVVYDTVTNFGGTYTPQNANKKEYGLITFRKALQGSLNIPAIKALYLVGGEKGGKELAERFGYHLNPTSEYGLTMVLGGAEMNMLEHANAYNTLANNGRYNPPAAVLKVENNRGEIVYEWHEESKEIIKPEFIATLNSVLTDNAARTFIFGAKSNLILPDRPVAAKTGTTNGSHDAWTLGYTPSLTAAAWVGNDKGKNDPPLKGDGVNLGGAIWNRFMVAALKGTPVEKFPDPPKKPDNLKPVLNGADGGIKVKINSLNGKLATSSTPPDLIVEKTFLPPHDILFYVDKSNPLGPYPENPAKDNQYERWEAGLQKWIEKEQNAGRFYSFEDVPTESDNSSDPSLSPTIEILSPTSSLITSRNMQFSVRATGPRGVNKVEFRIDNLLVGSSTQPPFTVSYSAQSLLKGEHKLQIVASDDAGNQGYKEFIFNLQSDLDPPSISWAGQQKTDLSSGDFPRAFSILPFRWEEIKEVKIYLVSDNDQKLLQTFSGPDALFAGSLSLTINQAPNSGSYVLKAIMTDKANRTLEKELRFTIR